MKKHSTTEPNKEAFNNVRRMTGHVGHPCPPSASHAAQTPILQTKEPAVYIRTARTPPRALVLQQRNYFSRADGQTHGGLVRHCLPTPAACGPRTTRWAGLDKRLHQYYDLFGKVVLKKKIMNICGNTQDGFHTVCQPHRCTHFETSDQKAVTSSFDSPLLMLTLHYLRNSEGAKTGENPKGQGQGHMVDALTLPNQIQLIFDEWLKMCGLALS
ncbi:hypothetical protein EVAR_58890_1 [Eumeta japonica]|uniref:Uncharacterized protein n=1 Tax=Eumeta variegata TaxID=151549 RepID=A0A4C1ZDH3_EUMVA|nr:hypothetical protein EVAR_58890_1 [Eumeta japonica]